MPGFIRRPSTNRRERCNLEFPWIGNLKKRKEKERENVRLKNQRTRYDPNSVLQIHVFGGIKKNEKAKAKERDEKIKKTACYMPRRRKWSEIEYQKNRRKKKKEGKDETLNTCKERRMEGRRRRRRRQS